MMINLTCKAVIFDLDGTLTDNMGVHREAFTRFGARYQLRPPDPEDARRLGGMRNREIMPILFRRELTDEEIERYAAEKEAIYRAMIAESCRPVAGTHHLLAALAARGIPCAIATSAPVDNVGSMLQLLGIADRFAEIVLGAEVPNGKPAPDIFLEAARRLGCAPADCLAFEDAFSGIAAAKAAGMRCIALATTHSADELRLHTAADLIVQDYEAFLAYDETWLQR